MERAQRGDHKAFDQLIKLWYPKIYNFSYKYFADHDDACEVSQKTFIAVYTKLSQLKDLDKFRPWIYQIVSNYCHETQRKKRRTWINKHFPLTKRDPEQAVISLDVEGRERNLQSDYTLFQNELSGLLRKALSMVCEEQRIIVIMKEYEGFKFSEIAEILQISENTAKSRLYYGLKKLKEIFKHWNITQENLNYER
ncbi:MAG: RNA polymerase sigma factor [Microscillaceae bacterium]|nr:RNA polymerase sigma factor [Microscillaceae bacterium]